MVTETHRQQLLKTTANLVADKLTSTTDVDMPIYREMAALLPPSAERRTAFIEKLTSLIKESPAYQQDGDPLSLTPRTGLLRQALYESGATMPLSDDRLVVDFNTGNIENRPMRGAALTVQESYMHPYHPETKSPVFRTEHMEPVSLEQLPFGRSA